MIGKRLAQLSAVLFLTAVCGTLDAAQFQPGDVFASVNHNKIQVYSSAGALRQTLDTKLPPGEPSTAGSFCDKSGNLYVTTFMQSSVARFDRSGTLLTPFVDLYTLNLTYPESILFDAAGNAYVGDAGQQYISKFDANGKLLEKYRVKIGDKGTDWIDLAADQKTMYYTSEDGVIRRFDVSAKTQLPDFANVGGELYALRILPDGGVLVAHHTDILRLDSGGKIVHTYAASSAAYWFALNLDPDGTSFWSADLKSGHFNKFDIQSGKELLDVATGAAPMDLAGLSVYGEKTAATDLPGGAKAENAMTTNAAPPECGTGLPTSVTSFLPTDDKVYLYFQLKGGQAGDVLATQWLDPTGKAYTDGYVGGSWQPLPNAGDFCVTGDYLAVAGKPAANIQGTWTINGTLNGAPLFTLHFTIGPPSAGGLKVVINQDDTTRCPEVKLSVTVTDEQGNPVGGLTANNFTLTEDGQPRAITVTGGASAGGNSVALLLDISGSVGPFENDLKSAAKNLVSQLPSPVAVALYTFASKPAQVKDFTADHALINAGIDSITTGGGTALYDGIAAAVQGLRGRQGARTLIVETDGVDNASAITLDTAILQAKDAGVTVFMVGVGSGIDETALKRIATETGGIYKAAPSAADLIPVLQAIGATIANGQYVITYTSGGGTSAHNIQLTANSGGLSGATTRVVAACATGPSTTDGVVLTVEDASGTPGQSIDVPVTLKATGARPASFQLDVSYDDSLVTFNSAHAGDQLTAVGKDVSSTVAAKKVTVIGAGLNQNVIGDGAVALLNFTLSPSFPANTKAILSCSNPVSVDAQSRALKTTCTSGAITAKTGCSCDVNGDGVTNVADVQLIINQVLGKVAGGCDLNGDGQINVLDVQKVVNAALGQGCGR